MNVRLYANIRYLRRSNKMSQDELARLTGYTDRSSISKIEKGEVDLRQSKIELFAKAFGVRPSELIWSDLPDTKGNTLTDKEIEILGKYNALDATEKAMVEERMDTLLEKKTERMESVCG